MPTSAVEICNLALLRVGDKRRIAALTDLSVQAQLCSTIYPIARNAALARFEWSFCRKDATLALIADVEPEGWAYAYALPARFLSARYLHLAGERNPAANQRPPYELQSNAAGDGIQLATDVVDAVLAYTASPTNDSTLMFPPLFVDAVAWKTAMDLAMALPVKPQVGLAMERGYERALLLAAARDANQSRQKDEEPEAEAIRAR